MMYCTTMDSPLGLLSIVSDGSAITGLWMEGQRFFGPTEKAQPKDDLPVLKEAATWLCAYFSGKNPGRLPPLAPHGTDFQKRVWQQLLKVPPGRTISYGELAKALHCPSPRAVGQAVGRNPIAILIPCHRVIGAGKKPGGYAGGTVRKAFLLSLEQISAGGG